MILTKRIEIRALEAEFIRLGGEIDRTNRGHVMFKCPGLPTVGVHVTRVRAPRRLISSQAVVGRPRPARPAPGAAR